MIIVGPDFRLEKEKEKGKPFVSDMFKSVSVTDVKEGRKARKEKIVTCHYCNRIATMNCGAYINRYQGVCLRACCGVHGKDGLCLGH